MNLKDNYNKINFKDIKFCNYSEILSILEIRNEEKVRINMFNNKVIAIDEHLNWSNEIKNSKFKKFYIIEYYDKIIGGLSLINISETKRSAEWAFYITQKNFFVGLGSLIEYKSLEFFF